ncbi:MAG: FAD-dependent oxidoreductase [Actinobacteria bacterium]|nr:FAD-dependent oxidoreductase [Actinomycetota bacterium]
MAELNRIDAVVIGAGHSGCETAKTIASEGFRTLLITINLDAIAIVSGSPLMNISRTDVMLIDKIGLLERPVGMIDENLFVIDNREYFIYMKECVENIEHLQVRQAEVTGIIKKNEEFVIRTRLGDEYRAKAVVICVGTFLKATCVFDGYKTSGGRHGEIASDDLCRSLEEIGYEFKDSAMLSSPVVRIARELEEKCKWMEVKYHCNKTNSKTTPKYCYLYKIDNDRSVLFVPLGVNTFEYCVSDYYFEKVSMDFFNSFIKKLEDKSLVTQTRAPYRVNHRALKREYLNENGSESSVHGGMFFAGSVCGTTGVFGSIMDGLAAGRDAVSYLRGKKNDFGMSSGDGKKR